MQERPSASSSSHLASTRVPRKVPKTRPPKMLCLKGEALRRQTVLPRRTKRRKVKRAMRRRRKPCSYKWQRRSSGCNRSLTRSMTKPCTRNSIRISHSLKHSRAHLSQKHSSNSVKSCQSTDTWLTSRRRSGTELIGSRHSRTKTGKSTPKASLRLAENTCFTWTQRSNLDTSTSTWIKISTKRARRKYRRSPNTMKGSKSTQSRWDSASTL